MITPGEGFFKPAASSLLIVLFCYLCESERENFSFFPEDFLAFSRLLTKGRDRQTHFLSERNEESEESKRRRKQTESIIINHLYLEGARAPKFTRTKRNERKSEVLPADTKKNSNRTITAADRLLLFAAVATCA